MRIGFDAKRAFHNATGLGNYSRDVIRLFTNQWPNAEFFLLDPVGKGIHFDYNLFNAHIISSQRRTGLGKNLWRRYGMAREVSNLHLNIFHGLSNELPVGIEKTNVKSLVTVHDLIYEKHPEWYPTIDRKIYRNKVRSAIEVADVVVAISQQTRNDLLEEYKAEPSKIEVIYQGCNPAFNGQLTPEQIHTLLHSFNLPSRFALYLGTIEPRKNLHTLIEALRDQDVPLVVVGRTTGYLQKVHDMLKGSRLERHYFFLTDLNVKHLAALYQAATVFVYPSLYEGFGIPIIEALNCGTPVVTGGGSMAEAGGPGCLSINTTDAEELRNAVLKIWYDDALRANMSVLGKQHVQQFTDQALWESWVALYQSHFRAD